MPTPNHIITVIMDCNIMAPVSAMNDVTVYSLVFINICTSLLTIVINYCFIAGMLSTPSLLTPTNLFIISLSVSDFLVGLIVQPLACALLLVKSSAETPVCMLRYLVFISLSIFCGASGLCVPIISVDRYIRMKKLQYYLKYVTKKRACLAIGCIWLNASVLAFTPFYGIPQHVVFITLIIYLLVCSLIMAVAYNSVVKRSVAFTTRPLASQPVSGQSNRDTSKARSSSLVSDQDGPKPLSFLGDVKLHESSQSDCESANVLSAAAPPSAIALRSLTEEGRRLSTAERSRQVRITVNESLPSETVTCALTPEERRCLGTVENSRQMRITVNESLPSGTVTCALTPEERRCLGTVENSRQMRITVNESLPSGTVTCALTPEERRCLGTVENSRQMRITVNESLPSGTVTCALTPEERRCLGTVENYRQMRITVNESLPSETVTCALTPEERRCLGTVENSRQMRITVNESLPSGTVTCALTPEERRCLGTVENSRQMRITVNESLPSGTVTCALTPEERRCLGTVENYRQMRITVNESLPSETVTCALTPEERRCLIDSSRQMRITVTVCLLVAIVVASWMPTFVFSLIWALDKQRMKTREMIISLHYIALTFGFACSCVNPILYCSRIREVRKSAINVFWRTLKCKRYDRR